MGNSSCLWISFNVRSKIVGMCFCESCLLKFGKKSATIRLIQLIFDKLNTLKSRQICLNTSGFYSKVSRQTETEYCLLA